ncbi:DNA translocase FtsK [Microvirga sp. BT688]|uniref:DNA translocase FtsK n=1 Tax=Microvirga sp. TaxID=1873136 RepID=UPI001683EF5A|nr:DNA translocase FtsK [Microvirga sp.]MBD2749125.1 DNA translocase FtsK [Microvirga sp.]
MHSTRKPPFAPPALPGEDNAREVTNIVRLRQDRRNAEAHPTQDGDEPPWRQAFVLAEGVKATRTPDKVIRARNGHGELPSMEPRHPTPAVNSLGEHIRSVIDEEIVGASEPAIRSQIAELQLALASEDPVSERLASLADREAALAAAVCGETAGSARRTIETATRLPLPQHAPAVDEAPHQEHHPATQPELAATPFSLTSGAVSFSWQGLSYGLAGVGSAGNLDALSAAPTDGQILEITGVVAEVTNDGQADPDGASEAEYDAAIEAALPSEHPQETAVETGIAVAVGEVAPAVPGASASDPIEEVDLGYLTLYEDLLPAASKKPQTGKVALQPQPEPVVVSGPALVPNEAADSVREHTEEVSVPGAMTEPGQGEVALMQPLQEFGPVLDLPKIAPSTWGHPISCPQAPGDWSYQKPDIAFLAEAPEREGPELTEDILEETAGRLEKVIRDFGVKGEVIHVHPGPVVTLYEFEPAPGIKSSRVIALSEDIARSMSAISARVAVIPGRNAIGIELPNETRETVYLRELLASDDFEVSKHKLPLCLGKTIGGEAVIADLARMPHLLVAGTTGSGKSVAINTMILSLVYRFTPEECRLIMVDPKMLELSVYDGIPHLLTPVVTDPKKAIIALRWAVREMEDRYKKMAKLGVRNIDGFNARVSEARANGEVITRTVQTGFDRTTGELTYTEEVIDLASLPYIVVIVDEMADLMMVAGKEIEGAIQRLAQMARAAGIHVILATQRPSVDVITGTIKANFPTRISFQVTSKIDSRTILGEMGAEQLLGQGDMLFMQGGGRIARVHGPFVSDMEVERVVAHLKRQAKPVYVDAVTADDEEMEPEETPVSDECEMGLGSGELFDQAVSIVLRHKKASTSYIQRRLQIGYNRAASLMERMEKEGIVGPANHAGKRDILIGTGGADEE